MPIKALILAGGLGTRLRPVLPGRAKPLAPIGDKVFIEILIEALLRQKIAKIILSIGYQAPTFINYFQNKSYYKKLEFITEERPLGTGGAIKYALQQLKLIDQEMILVLNGDSFVQFNLANFLSPLNSNWARILLRKVPDTGRYGMVKIKADKVTHFAEKSQNGPGLINAGIYLLKGQFFKSLNFTTEQFSWENDVLAKFCHLERFTYQLTEGFFIDIGTPQDYQKLQANPKLINYE